MKKFLQATGLIALLAVTFFSTEQTILVVKDMDDIMVELKQKSKAYEVKPQDAIIKEDTIVPGIAGKTVDINKSYVKMKQYGKFDPNLLIYKQLSPAETLDHHYKKFIVGGNTTKRMVSLLFRVSEADEIEKIRNILREKQVAATFFIDGNWLEQHVELLEPLIAEGHTIGNFSYHRNYKDSSFVWIDTIIKRIGKQQQSYCYAEKKEQSVIDVCHLYQDMTIVPTMVLKDQPLTELKKQLKAGSLISLPISDQVEQELPSMIQYIESRGYQLTNLGTHLKE